MDALRPLAGLDAQLRNAEGRLSFVDPKERTEGAWEELHLQERLRSLEELRLLQDPSRSGLSTYAADEP